MVDLHARRPVAVGEALGLFERDHPVQGGATCVHAEGGLRVLEQLGGAVEEAGDVRADRDQVGADRGGVQHVVEGGGAVHLSRCDPDQCRDVLHRAGGEPPLLFLREVAEGDQGGTWFGVERDRSRARSQVCSERCRGPVALPRARDVGAPIGTGSVPLTGPPPPSPDRWTK